MAETVYWFLVLELVTRKIRRKLGESVLRGLYDELAKHGESLSWGWTDERCVIYSPPHVFCSLGVCSRIPTVIPRYSYSNVKSLEHLHRILTANNHGAPSASLPPSPGLGVDEPAGHHYHHPTTQVHRPMHNGKR